MNTETIYEQEDTILQSKVNPNRELSRYVFCLGDHIEPKDKRSLNSTIGGIWIGHSEVEGAPTMKRTKFMLRSCAITPLETTPIGKKADHKAEKRSDESYLAGTGVPPGTRGYNRYAGDDLQFLQNDRFRPLGIVELSALMGQEWAMGFAEKCQVFFFPDWYKWLAKQKPFPILIKDRIAIVNEAIQKAGQDSVEASIGEEMLESGRLFQQYASSHIERNRQMIQSMRNTNMGGFFIGWTEKTRLYANQLGLKLEDEDELRAESREKNGENRDSGIILEMQKDRALRERELEVQKEQNKLMMALLTGNLTDMGQLKELLTGGNTEIQKPVAPSLEAVKEEVSQPEEPTGEFDVSLHQVSGLVEVEELEQPTSQVAEIEQPTSQVAEIEQPVTEIEKSNTTEGNKIIEPLKKDGQCHGIRKATGERCKITSLTSEGLYCDRHSR